MFSRLVNVSFDTGYTPCVLSAPMTPAETTKLIDKAGGNTAFAALLGIDQEPGYQQRLTNWKRRGMPPAVILEHHEKILKLQTKLAKSNRAA